jgi:starch synthase
MKPETVERERRSLGTTRDSPAREEIGVVHLVAEFWPFARTGGLAEAVRGMAEHQARVGIRTAVFMPFYGEVRERHPELRPFGEPFRFRLGSRAEEGRLFHLPDPAGGPEVYFVEHGGYFDRAGIYANGGTDYPDNHLRFGFYCRAVLEALPQVFSGAVVLHAHDWHAALAPVYLRAVLSGNGYYDRLPAVLTVHNAGFQGHFGYEALEELGLPDSLFDWQHLEWYGRVNCLKGGLVFSDHATTVSPTHAHELRTRQGGFGLHETFIGLQDRFSGILNGIDLSIWDPETDPEIEATYSTEDLSGKKACKRWLQEASGLASDPSVPLFGMTARLVEQKGLDLILGSGLLSEAPAQFVFLGTGEARYERALAELAAAAPERIAVRFEFTETREHRLLAGADLLLMPSLYEPCGLTQMRAQRYGVIPVARRVGGLTDTIQDQVTGFLFDEYEPWALEEAVRRALDLFGDGDSWVGHMRKAMARDFGWHRSAEQYLDVYARVLEWHGVGR